MKLIYFAWLQYLSPANIFIFNHVHIFSYFGYILVVLSFLIFFHILFFQEACRLLPEIAGPYTHPKVAHVLLERQNPDAGLMALRWSGQDGGATLVSLGEALTAVQVRVECGLLTEAFMCQRMICTKLKDKKLKDAHDEVNDQLNNWQIWLKILVSEICCLCIKRSVVDRIIDLPWNADEEKHIHKCLFDIAKTDPSSSVGSLLVVFYLQVLGIVYCSCGRYQSPIAYLGTYNAAVTFKPFCLFISTRKQFLCKFHSYGNHMGNSWLI